MKDVRVLELEEKDIIQAVTDYVHRKGINVPTGSSVAIDVRVEGRTLIPGTLRMRIELEES